MEEQESLTVRFPVGLLTKWKLHKLQDKSLNDVMIKVLEREIRYHKGLAAHHRIVARRESIGRRTGTQQSSVILIRQLREGDGRDD